MVKIYENYLKCLDFEVICLGQEENNDTCPEDIGLFEFYLRQVRQSQNKKFKNSGATRHFLRFLFIYIADYAEKSGKDENKRWSPYRRYFLFYS